jgi:hypothetical protein
VTCVAIAPERVAELIRSLAEARHSLGVLTDELDGMTSPLAQLYALELQQNLRQVDDTFEVVHRLARPLTELRDESFVDGH